MTATKSPPSELRILIADQYSLFVEGIVAMLRKEGFEQLEIFDSSMDRLLQKLSASAPDVLLLAHSLGGLSGIDSAEQVLARYPNQRILLVLMKVNQAQVMRILRMGVKGILCCDSRCDELVSAVERVGEGRTFLSQTVNEVMLGQFYHGDQSEGEAGQNLSARELEVLRMLALGYPNREVAEKLHISVRTVDSHRSHILQKIDGGSTADLVRYALREGIISLDEQRV